MKLFRIARPLAELFGAFCPAEASGQFWAQESAIECLVGDIPILKQAKAEYAKLG